MPSRGPTCCRPAGLTLIEVVAAVALMGVMVGGLLSAQRSYLEVEARSTQRQRALASLDRFLETTSPQALYSQGEGALPNGYRWRVRDPAPFGDRLGVSDWQTIEVVVFDAADDDPPLGSLVIALPAGQEPSTQQDASGPTPRSGSQPVLFREAGP